MPINEAVYRSNLNPQQQRAAEVALFKEQMNYSDGYSQQHESSIPKEFDLNNPPRQRYVYQEFPRMMYHHVKRETRIANNENDVKAATKAGWSKEPFPMEVEQPEPSSADLAAIAQQDAQLRKPKE